MKISSIALMVVIYCICIVNAFASTIVVMSCNDRNAASCIESNLLTATSQQKILLFSKNIYFIETPVKVPSGAVIDGNGSTIKLQFTKPNLSAFIIDSVKGVTIKNLTIDGGGFFSSEIMRNPYSLFESYGVIGFSNANRGISISGNSSHVAIFNDKFINLNHGIYADGVLSQNGNLPDGINVSACQFNRMGQSAISLHNVANVNVSYNTIDSIQGNFVYSITPKIYLSKFADGLYFEGLQNAIISFNKISNVKRIGIVLEGATDLHTLKPFMINDNIYVENNNISNVNGSRGTEYNAGIWVEPYVNSESTDYYKTKNIVIKNNIIDNRDALLGKHAQWGIRLGGLNNIVQNNKVMNFTGQGSAGIVYSYGMNLLESNSFYNVTQAIQRADDNQKRSIIIVR